MSQRRVWITGVGVISALGPDRRSLSQALLDGRGGIRPTTLFDPSPYRSRWAGQSPDPAPPAVLGPFARCSRADLLGLQAAAEAIDDAGLPQGDLHQAAVIMGTGAGGADHTTRYIRHLRDRGERHTPAAWLVPHQPANAADIIATRLGAGGPRCTLMTACSSSATALGIGMDMIRLGRVRHVIAGGTEGLCELTYGGFSALRAMDESPCRPFHAQRKGLTLGDGSAILLLEDAQFAARRGATPHAELAGYGVSSDAYHLTAPAPDGRGAVAAMRAALQDAGIAADAVQYVNAHGTATSHNDPIEAHAIRQVFGAHAESALAVSSTKAMTGHTLGAAGALEAVICALCIRHGVIPPTLGLDHVDPACAGLDLVPLTPRPAALQAVLSNSFAFGGNNTSIVLRSVS